MLVVCQKLKEKVPSQCLIVADKVNFTKIVECQSTAGSGQHLQGHK